MSSVVSNIALVITHTRYYRATDEDEEEEEEGTSPPAGLNEGRNSQLTVGYKGDRSYVVRGDKIGVFRHKPDEVEYVASIANITDMKGKKFDPKNVRLALDDLSFVHLQL
jgi:VID27 C-terminal WD40-like domain